MMVSSSSSSWAALALLFFVAVVAHTANGDDHLSAGYYAKTCPNVESVVWSVMASRVGGGRMAPAVLRLFFHDCFVHGCDASVLLDATPFSEGEKDAEPNTSLTGFTVIDEIKSALERDCPATVSCADVLALASRDAVVLLGGPTWNMPLGRKDSRSAADKKFTRAHLPSPNDNLAELVRMFGELGLDARDMTALSGAHTVGMANCKHYRGRVYGTSDTKYNIDPSFAESRRQMCPLQGPSGDAGKAPFDVTTPMKFDNAYYRDLVAHQGLLNSDQALYGGGGVDNLVEMYSTDGDAFGRDFAKAMVKMGNISPPKGMPTEGCDASVLLDATPFSEGEKDAEPNTSLTGFTVIDEIKFALERDCPATVSCADVLALASRDAVVLLGGPTWNMPLGRKDSRSATDKKFTRAHLPSPNDNLAELVRMFGELGLDARDMTALSGAHTVGMANCKHYRGRVYGTSDTKYNIDPSFAESRRQMCPLQGPSGDAGKAPFDVTTPMKFDNAYYRDLVAHQGLLNSDQALYGGGGVDNLVEMYSADGDAFGRDFAKAMVKMGNISPPKGMPTEVRLQCSRANY